MILRWLMGALGGGEAVGIGVDWRGVGHAAEPARRL